MKNLISRYESDIKGIHEKHEQDMANLREKHRLEMEELRRSLEEDKNKQKSEYEKVIKSLQDKLADELRKMEDSNGYLKKMY